MALDLGLEGHGWLCQVTGKKVRAFQVEKVRYRDAGSDDGPVFSECGRWGQRTERQIWKDPRVGSAMLGEQNKLPCNMMLATIFSDKNQQWYKLKGRPKVLMHNINPEADVESTLSWSILLLHGTHKGLTPKKTSCLWSSVRATEKPRNSTVKSWLGETIHLWDNIFLNSSKKKKLKGLGRLSRDSACVSTNA